MVLARLLLTCSFLVHDSYFYDNMATTSGGAAYLHHVVIRFMEGDAGTTATFVNNSAGVEFGGALAVVGEVEQALRLEVGYSSIRGSISSSAIHLDTPAQTHLASRTPVESRHVGWEGRSIRRKRGLRGLSDYQARPGSAFILVKAVSSSAKDAAFDEQLEATFRGRNGPKYAP